MEIKYGYDQDPALLGEYLRGGVLLTDEEGVFVAWETRPELVKAALPPVLDYVDNVVKVYIMRIGKGNLGSAFMECALMLNASYQGKVGMYAPSFLMYGPGAEPATVMGRELYGISKKYADDVRVTRTGERVTASIIRGGRVIFDLDCRINGQYNDAEKGLAALGMPKKGDCGPGSSYFFTYDAHHVTEPDGDRHIVFDAVHLNDAVSNFSHLADWEPGTVDSVDMEESVNDPWSYFEVEKLLGCGWTVQQLHMVEHIQHRNVGDPVANMAKMIPSKFDLAAFGGTTKVLNTEFN